MIEGHRLYRPLEFLDCLGRNLCIAIEVLLIGHPGLEPEQDGDTWCVTRFDWLTVILLVPGLYLFWRYGSWTVFLFFLSPVLPSMFLEMGNKKERGPRVWLSRWYMGVLALVSVYSRFPRAWQVSLLILWTLQSWGVSGHYRTPEAYYRQWLSENPNPDHYRLTALAFELLRTGHYSEAEDEYNRALDYDSGNVRAGMMLALFAQNRGLWAQGILGLGFRCGNCWYRDARFIKDGDVLNEEEYRTYIERTCPKCGVVTEHSII